MKTFIYPTNDGEISVEAKDCREALALIESQGYKCASCYRVVYHN